MLGVDVLEIRTLPKCFRYRTRLHWIRLRGASRTRSLSVNFILIYSSLLLLPFKYIYKFYQICHCLFYSCIAVGDEGLAALVTGCKKIKKLNVCYCTQITDQGMKHLSRLEELKEIEIRGLTQVTSLGITAIAIGCRSLAKLDMKHCDSVDDVGFLALAQHSEFLRQVHFQNSS